MYNTRLAGSLRFAASLGPEESRTPIPLVLILRKVSVLRLSISLGETSDVC